VFQKAVKSLDVANIPHKTLFSTSTSINDVHGDNADSTKTSKDAGNNASNDDSFHHILTSFHNGLLILVSHHQCRSNQLRQTGRENLFSSLPVSGWNILELNILHKQFGCERRVDVAVNDNNSIFTPVQSEGLVAALDSVAFTILNNPDVNLGVGGIGVLDSIEDVLFKFGHFLFSFLVLTSFP
jgi:hypothetical protein